MGLDMLIPFSILLVLVIYLIYTRSKFEKDIVQLYEKKFEEWKNNSSLDTKKDSNNESPKLLAGLVYKQGYKLKIELLDESVKDNLEKGKFKIDNLKG
ncbi:hypothetical protein [Arcobacter sp. YIC-80]|uniref:hypothetical protein n=1 Tax=unclassified Arcobacter TaxID=2593671 RepID=UPI00385177D5